MPYGSNSWTRLAYTPSSGEMKVDGDLFAVLGINADEITHSEDPFKMLPDSVAQGLIHGKDIVRDEKLSLVIIPGKTGPNNSVTIIAEQIADYDLVSDIAGGVVGFAPDGTILRWNLRMTYLFGPREKDVIGRGAADILPSPVLYDWESVISSAHLGHEVKIEFQPSGERRVEGVLSRGGPGVIGLFRDSTESYKTSKRLRALNRLNQAYLQSTGTGLLLLDSRLRILLSNSGFTRITGHRGSLIGLQLHDILSADSYKWVHDASEHLSADERAEQSGVVSFVNQNGRQVTLRHTLRAVRNETNQALNFVCLFEDETDLTIFRESVVHLKKSLTDISRISEGIQGSESGEDQSICEELLRVTRSTAVAQYYYDPYGTMKLFDSVGSWPKALPVKELSELRFPAYVWGGDKLYRIASTEMGKLSAHFKSCTVLPIGKGLYNRGFLLLADSLLSDSDSALLNTVSSMIDVYHQITQERAARSAAEKHLELNAGFAETLFDGIPLPIAIIRMDGRVDHWNRAMEQVSGVKTGEVENEDIDNLIDPERAGFTLDSHVSGSELEKDSSSAEWTVRRRDGSRSAIHRWNVSIIDSSVGYLGDPAFLVTGIASEDISPGSDVLPSSSLERKLFLKEITELLSELSPGDVLHTLARVCFMTGGSGIIEFHSNGEFIAVFPETTDRKKDADWNFQLTRSILGIEYDIKVFGFPTQETVNSVIDLISFRDAGNLKARFHSEPATIEIQKYSTGLTDYLEKFFSDSIEQSNAMVHLVDRTDPLAGFARTMLFSQETASRVSHLLSLSILVRSGGFKEEYPDRFLARLHSVFAEKGLRPPSLSLGDKLPLVMIIPHVILHCFAILCQLAIPHGVVLFTARNADDCDEDTGGVRVILSGLNEPLQTLSQLDIHQQLGRGMFGAGTETGIIFRLLNCSGCKLLSMSNGELTFLLDPAY